MNFIDVQNVPQLNAFNSFVNFKFLASERVEIKKNDILNVWKKLFSREQKTLIGLWICMRMYLFKFYYHIYDRNHCR